MTKNPIINAFAATAYISVVASLMYYGSEYAGKAEDTILAPIAILSLFTLSAAMMGYLFLSQPLQLYLDGEKKQGVTLFIRTVGIFAVLTFGIFAVFLSTARF